MDSAADIPFCALSDTFLSLLLLLLDIPGLIGVVALICVSKLHSFITVVLLDTSNRKRRNAWYRKLMRCSAACGGACGDALPHIWISECLR